jgi:hypothetical protein
MTVVTLLGTCDGFTVEGADGCLGWVEETWLDADGRPGALAVRTPDGRRALLLAGDVRAVDPDAQEVFAVPDADLLALEPPRLASADGTIAATWRATTEHVVPARAGAHAAPQAPALGAARAATARHERSLARTAILALAGLATVIALFIGLAFGIATLVTGHPY